MNWVWTGSGWPRDILRLLGSPVTPVAPLAPLAPVTIGQRVFLLNRDRDEILVAGQAGWDFTNLQGELPVIAEVRCGDRTRRALVQAPGREVVFEAALPHAGELATPPSRSQPQSPDRPA